MANTILPLVCGGDAALCQITLTTCYYWDRWNCRTWHWRMDFAHYKL